MPTDPDAPGNEPNLELPSFGFGRRKKRGQKSSETSSEIRSETSSETAPTTPVPSTEEPDAEPPAAEATIPPPTAPRAPVAPPAPEASAAPSPARPPARPAARPPSRPAAAVAPAPAPARPAPARPVPPPPVAPPPVQPPVSEREPEPDREPAPDHELFLEPTAVDPLDQAAAAFDQPRADRGRRQGGRASSRARRRAEKNEAKRAQQDAEAEPIETVETAEAQPVDIEPGASAPAEALVARLPAINPLYAAILSGVLSGLAAVLLAFGAARGCDAVRGTESCGGGIGLLALVAILAIEVLIGANLLKAWQIADPYSTSFLGVGVVTTIAMLAFLGDINSPWMLLVIPLMTAASFALSWWVTVRFIDEQPIASEVDADQDEASHA